MEEKKPLLQDLKERVVAESPTLFVNIRNICFTLVGIAVAIQAASLSVKIPDSILDVCGYVIAIGSAMGATAIITKK